MPRVRPSRGAPASPSLSEKKRRPRRSRPADSDALAAAEAAEALGRTYPTQFNLEREQRQLVLDPLEGLRPYPAEFRDENLTAEMKVAKIAYDRAHHLVVIEWGGSKPPGRAWGYSKQQCEDVRRRGLAAELNARQAWGLVVVSPALRGVKAPRTTRVGSRSHRESPEEHRRGP